MMVSQEYSVEDLVTGPHGWIDRYAYVNIITVPNDSHSRTAATWRHNGFADWHIGDKTAVLWGASRDMPDIRFKQKLRNHLIEPAVCFSTQPVFSRTKWPLSINN